MFKALRITNPTAKADAITAGTVVFFLATYTAYDKLTKRFNVRKKLADVLLFKVSVRYTLGELNKVLGLAGLTLVSGALAAQKLDVIASVSAHRQIAERVLLGGATLARIHCWYSTFTFSERYGNAQFQTPMYLGVGAVLALNLLQPYAFLEQAVPALSDFGQRHWTVSALAILGVASAHFYRMESTAGQGMQCRPAGYAALAAAAVAGAAILARKLAFLL